MSATSPGRTVRFAVLSDLHAIASKQHSNETYTKRWTDHRPTRNPLAAIRALIADSKDSDDPLRADAVLCPGDLAHRMEPKGLKYGWEQIIEIASLLGAKKVVATAGNHDVIRAEDLPAEHDDHTWVGPLKSLSPHFPARDADTTDEYFGEDYTVVEDDLWRVVALNSCSRHRELGEYSHGQIDEMTLTNVAATIESSSKAVNVFMCHHHPIEWNHIDRNDTSHMRGGQQLIHYLENEHDGQWLFLHGHRHVPALGYAGESAMPLVRFSAGSIGMYLQREGRSYVRNQFYMLEYDLDEIDRLGLANAGRFRAWDFNYNGGMTPADRDADLPGHGGFGYRADLETLVTQAQELARNLGGRSVTWQQLCDADGRWRYLAPLELKKLRRRLATKHSAKVRPNNAIQRIDGISFP